VLKSSPDRFRAARIQRWRVAFHHYLGLIRERYRLPLHGVGLSDCGEGPLTWLHLEHSRLFDLNGLSALSSFPKYSQSSYGPVSPDLLPLAPR